MESMYFLIPLALVLFGLSIWFFFWAVKHNQFEDLEREANRILFDEDADKLPTHPGKTPPP